jgi:dethiobiotin synthetase
MKASANESPRGQTRGLGRILFVTGTDTGVGKTLLTGMLYQHLRNVGVRALALKPFCSGGRSDAQLLHRLQEGELTLDEINPFHFSEPLAPLLCARREGRVTRFEKLVDFVSAAAARCECLLVEGAGGLLSPLGEGFAAVELICALGCEVILVARNKLGTINHALLTVKVLENARGETVSQERWAQRRLQVVLMDVASPDPSSASNPLFLRDLLPRLQVLRISYLGPGASEPAAINKNAKKFHKTLATILGNGSV